MVDSHTVAQESTEGIPLDISVLVVMTESDSAAVIVAVTAVLVQVVEG